MRPLRQLSLLVVLLLGCPTPPPVSGDGGTPPTCFSVTPAALDFGEVETRAPVVRAVLGLTIVNDTLEPTGLSGQVGSPFELSPPGTMLAPHTSASLSVFFSPADGRRFVDEVVLTAADGGCETRVPVQGLGSGRLSVPSLLDFGVVAPGTRKTLPLTFTNSRRTPVTLSALEVTPALFEVGAITGVVPPGGTLVVPVTAAPVAEAASLGALTAASDDGPVNVALTVQGGVQAIEAAPLVLRAPRVGLWASGAQPPFIERTVTLRNLLPPGAAPVRFAGMLLVPEFGAEQELRISSSSVPLQGLEGGARGVLTLRLEPFSLGPHRYTVSLLFNPTQPVTRLTFDANVVSLPPCALVVSPAPPRLDLTALPDGGAQAVVTLDNPGPDECVVDDVQLDSPTLRLRGGGEQVGVAAGAHHQLVVEGPMPDAGASAGTLRLHVLRPDEAVSTFGVFAP